VKTFPRILARNDKSKLEVSFAYDTQLRTLLGSHSHFLGVAWLDYLGSFGFTSSPLAAPTAELFVESDCKLIVTVNYFLKLQGLVLELASYLCDSGDINKDMQPSCIPQSGECE
jgi:hypothetical protein